MLPDIISIAPMLRWTDRHCRYFHRLLTKQAVLYTEMVATGAILHGDREHFLGFDPIEHPVVLQLGGSDPKELAECAKIGADFGYDEVNLNVGCPSERVQAGKFGACLILEPELVAECIAAMCKTTDIPITVKTRLGIENQGADLCVRPSYENLYNFVQLTATAGCNKFIIHARSAKLRGGFNPKKNRQLPLCYDLVYKLKQDFPDLTIITNGGIKTYAQIEEQLKHVDGVMLGRDAYRNPYILAEIDQRFYGSTQKPLSRQEIFDAVMIYTKKHPSSQMMRHIQGLFHGMPNAKKWRRDCTEYVSMILTHVNQRIYSSR